MRITRLLSAVVFLSLATVARAENFNVILPFGAGNNLDLIVRTIADSVERNTGNRLIVANMPGADGIVGTQHFLNTADADVLVSASSIHVFNYVLKETVPYKESDFRHIVSSHISQGWWITRPNSNIKTPADLVTKMPANVASVSVALNINLASVQKKTGTKSRVVTYKTASAALIDVVNGTVDLAILAPSTSIMEMVKAGKLHIVGSTLPQDVTVDSVAIPSVSQALSVKQFNGYGGFSVKSTMDTARADRVQKILWQAVNDPAVQDKIKKLYSYPMPKKDTKEINKWLEDYQQSVRTFAK